MLSAEIHERVTEGLSGLTPLERAAFMLRHIEGRSIQEIGAALGLKTDATKHSVFRAVRKMRVVLEPLADRGRAVASPEPTP
jgi:RNA polymerase sigma-70 factor (ECF subfamily)